MHPILKIFQISVLLIIAFFLQFAVSRAVQGIFFFPAVALYAATFLSVPYAVFMGVLFGSVLDSFSPMPFGIYAIGMGSSMATAAFGMRFLDERRIVTHAFAALVVLGVFTAMGEVLYFVFGYAADEILLYARESAVAAIALGILAGLHGLIKRLNNNYTSLL